MIVDENDTEAENLVDASLDSGNMADSDVMAAETGETDTEEVVDNNLDNHLAWIWHLDMGGYSGY